MRTLIASSAVVVVALAAAAPVGVAQAQRQDQTSQTRFCVIVGTEGQARCAYRSLAQCQRATPRGATGRCFDRTYMLAATTPPAAAAAPAERSASPRGVAKRRGHRPAY